MHHITFLDHATFPQSTTFPAPCFNHRWHSYASTSPEKTAEHLRDTTIAITNKVAITEAILQQCPKLKYIAVAATGVDIVDLLACKRRGIIVANVAGYATHSVAEHVLMLMLALIKQLKGYHQALAQQQWQKNGQFCFFLEGGIHSLQGKTLGLIGTGSIALATAKLAQAFGMRTVFYSPSNRASVNNEPCLTLTQLLAQSDVISVHCPLTASTRHLINRQTVTQMRDSAILINTARGPIVDEQAVIDAVKEGALAGAGLDVFAQEPPALNSAVMHNIGHPNIIITPHTAWASESAMQQLANQLMQKIEAYAAGKAVANLAQ